MSISDQEKAEELRVQALELLRQAQDLDGKKPFLVTHSHQYGDTNYIGYFEEAPTQEQAEALLESDFEEDRDETLNIDELNIAELIGHPELKGNVNKPKA